MGQSSVLAEEHLETAPETGEKVTGRSPWQLFWSRFAKDRVAIGGAVLIIELVLLALCAPLVAKLVGHGPNDLFDHMLDEIGLPAGPNQDFWFGADKVGRDLFVRTIYAVRTSLIVALVATSISVIIGIVLGTIAGFFGGFADTAISRTVDLVMSLPILLFAIGLAATCGITAQGCLGGHLQWAPGIGAIVGWILSIGLIAWGLLWRQRRPGAGPIGLIVLGLIFAVMHLPLIPLPTIQPGLSLVIFVIALVNWTYIGRIVRGQVLTLREREFVEAARALGATNSRIMFRELLPNLAAPIIVYSTLIIPANILFEAALSFLGVGIPQSTPSLGRMLAEASSGQLFTVAWWMMVFPGIFLVLLTLAFNLLGDGLRDALDPRGRRGG
jgi:ABC-type dipeptide/oligopeptide/nickel transport system permease subunit